MSTSAPVIRQRSRSAQMRRAGTVPVVCIGMPIYNGALTLRPALDALLVQDFRDFEIHICDNGSTDATPQLCEAYVARDSRVHYHRSDRNIGPIANFNRAFGFCQSKYFMFAADDDVRESSFLTKCVHALEQSPEAVLCSTLSEEIGADGQSCGVVDDGMETTALGRFIRLHIVLTKLHSCSAIYGVIRSDALARAMPLKNIYGPDFVVLVQLALLGPFLKVREILYHRMLDPFAPSDAGDMRAWWARTRGWWELGHPGNRRRWLFFPTIWITFEIVRFVMALEVSFPKRLILAADAFYLMRGKFGQREELRFGIRDGFRRVRQSFEAADGLAAKWRARVWPRGAMPGRFGSEDVKTP